MAKLETDHAAAVDAMQKLNNVAIADGVGGFTFGNQPPKGVVVTVDVEELQCPIELEVGSSHFQYCEGVR